MKLDDFLKFKKVRYIKLDGKGLTNKEYELLGVTDRSCIISDNGCEIWASMDNFEPVLESAENPLQGVELTPEFETEVSEPKFKVGDKVYRGLKGEIRTVERVEIKSLHFAEGGCDFIKHCCHATQENYEMLCKLYPHIEFEAPPKPLSGSDLARAMLDKGWKYVPCYVSNTSDKNAVELDDCGVIYTVNHNGNFQDGYGETWCHAVPFDPRTGEPLTESILND